MNETAIPELKLEGSDGADSIVAQLTLAFEALGKDQRYREGVNRFIPGARDVYGVRVPQLRALARQVLKVLGKQISLVEAIAEGCWKMGSREHCVLAILMLSDLKALEPGQRWALGLQYLPAVGDWETCDQLCMGLLGQALAEEPKYIDELESWVHDPNIWVRRAALASTVVLRRSKADAATRLALDQRALGICLQLLDDKEHYVRKAVDWAVREVIRRDYSTGKKWMMERGKTPLSTVARSTLKKAAKKLTAEDEDRFLRSLS